MKSSLFNRKNLLFVLALLAGSGIIFFFIWHTFHHPDMESPPTEEESGKSQKITVVAVESKELYREDELPGEIDAYQDVLIYPKVPGYIEWIGVDRGSVVKKDQLLARMYAPEYLARRNEWLAGIAAAKAAFAAEQSKLEDLKADLKRRKANLLADQSTYQRVYTASLIPGVVADNDVVQWSQTVAADQEYVNTTIKRVNAKAHEVSMRGQEVEAEQKAYDNFATFASYLELKSPFDGYVTERKLHVGSFVGPDGTGAYPPICRVEQLDLLRIVAPVPEVDTAGIIPGTQVHFTVSAFPGEKLTGTVARISNRLDRDTRTMPVELNFFNPDYRIFPGMFCRVYWPTHTRTASLFVPISSVVSTPLETFVCRIKDKTVEWVPVSKGQIMNGKVEIVGDITAGDLVAKVGTEDLQEKTKVEPVMEAATEQKKEQGQNLQGQEQNPQG